MTAGKDRHLFYLKDKKMGCDIHAHVEIKVNGKWEHYSTPKVDRHMDLFDLMAGIFGNIEPIVQSKGLPNDLSVVTSIDWNKWEQDAHNMSWLSAEEVEALSSVAKTHDLIEFSSAEVFGHLFGNSIESYVSKQRDLPTEVEDVRVVFWFDN